MDIILTAGQSNFANFYTPLDTTRPNELVSARGITMNDPFRSGYDPQPTADGTASSVFPILGNLITAYTNKPIGFICVGVSNSVISSWQPNATNYPRLSAAIAIAANPFLCFLWHNGETDSFLQTSETDYSNGLKAMIDQLRIDMGFQIPCGIAVVSHPNEATGAGVRAAQISVGTTYPGCFQGANTDTLGNEYRTDNVHFNSTTGRTAHATLWFNALIAANIIQPGLPSSDKNQSMIFSGSGIWQSR